MKILYPDNNATKIPRAIVGTCIQVRQWLRGEQCVPFLKSVFAFNSGDVEKYDDGQGREYDILDSELE